MIACDFCAIKLRNFYDFRDADLDAPICNHHVGMMNPVLFFSDFDAVALSDRPRRKVFLRVPWSCFLIIAAFALFWLLQSAICWHGV